MYIVNTSFVVQPEVQQRWLELITKRYIPFLKEEGFVETVFTRVISIEAVDHFTYSLQVYVSDMTQYKRLTEEAFAEYLVVADGLFSDRVVWFHSLLKRLD